jgi:excisionase family DNA binding protein
MQEGSSFMESSFLSISEASEYLGVKTSTLYSLVERKKIPHYRIGRLIKFKKAEIDEWVHEHKVDNADLKKEASRILNAPHKPKIDVDVLVRRSIAESKRTSYISNHGKSGRLKGLRTGGVQ